MAVTPEAKQRIMQELAEKDADRLKEALTKALDDGWLAFSRGRPGERRKAYIQNTLPQDVALVTDPKYLEKLSRGEAPMLLAVQIMKAKQEGRGANLQDPPQFWGQIISTLPGYVFAMLAADFKSLLQEEESPSTRLRMQRGADSY